MAQPNQFFELIRELFQLLGIRPCQSNQKYNYNLRNSFVLIILAQLFAASTAFLLFEANSIDEYGQSFYLTVTSLLLVFLWPCFIQNMGDLFKLMEQINTFAAKRKSKKSSQMFNNDNKINSKFQDMVRSPSTCMAK